jgi:predicted phosphodiesterase
MSDKKMIQQVGRRSFIGSSTLMLFAAPLSLSEVMAEDKEPSLRIGLLTDMHHADKEPAGTRYYRETLRKLEEAGSEFQKQRLSFVVELGDFIDAAESVEIEQEYLRTINREFTKLCNDRHYVLGNHCVDTLKKEEFLLEVQQEKSYYSFDRGDWHFVVLDACFRSDGEPYQRKNFEWTDANIPTEELAWLEKDLGSTDKKTIVFAHQRLDVNNNHGVKNNAQVRKIFEASKKVQLVLQGHSHQNDIKEIGGIHYCTLVAMIEGSGPENNGYSTMFLHDNGKIVLNGFRHQKSHAF